MCPSQPPAASRWAGGRDTLHRAGRLFADHHRDHQPSAIDARGIATSGGTTSPVRRAVGESGASAGGTWGSGYGTGTSSGSAYLTKRGLYVAASATRRSTGECISVISFAI